MSILGARSSKERLWLIAGCLAALVLVVVGYVGLIGPQRASTASVNAQKNAASAENTALESRIAGLWAQSHNMARYRAQLTAAQEALPADNAIPAFLRTLQKLGQQTDTDVVSVTDGAASPIEPTTTTAAPSGTATPTASTASVAVTPSVYSVPISVQVTGSDAALNNFLQQLQAVQPRAVLITQITEGAATSGTAGVTTTSNSLQLTMQAFYGTSS